MEEKVVACGSRLRLIETEMPDAFKLDPRTKVYKLQEATVTGWRDVQPLDFIRDRHQFVEDLGLRHRTHSDGSDGLCLSGRCRRLCGDGTIEVLTTKGWKCDHQCEAWIENPISYLQDLGLIPDDVPVKFYYGDSMFAGMNVSKYRP